MLTSETATHSPAILQELIAAALTSGNFATWSFNSKNNIWKFGSNAETLFGYPTSAFPTDFSHFCTHYLHPQDAPSLTGTVKTCLETRTAFTLICRIWDNHTQRWMQAYFASSSISGKASSSMIEGLIIPLHAAPSEPQDKTLTAPPKLTAQHPFAQLNFGSNEKDLLASIVQWGLQTLELSGVKQQQTIIDASKKLPELDHANPQFALLLCNILQLISNTLWWYKSLTDSIPFPVSVTTLENEWMYLNCAAQKVFQDKKNPSFLTEKQPHWESDFLDNTDLAESTTPFVFPHIAPNSQAKIQQEACAEQVPDNGSYSPRHCDLDYANFTYYDSLQKRFYQGQTSFLYDLYGNKTGYIEAMQDVTEIHQADERMRIMLDSTPLACNFWNADFNLIDCNLAAMKLFGFDAKKAYLEHFFELSPKRQPTGTLSKDIFKKYIEKAFASGSAHFDWVHQKKDGTFVPTEITMQRVQNGDEHIVVSFMHDQTELHTKDIALDKERRLLRKVMDSSPLCFVILVDGVVRFTNPHSMFFLGIDKGSQLKDFVPDSAQRASFLRELKQVGAVNWRIIPAVASDGSCKEMLVNAFLTDYYGEQCIMAWLLDVTEMQAKKHELQLARDAAEQSAIAKSEFLANMSHEIRTPMNAILGLTHLLLDTKTTAKQRDYLHKTRASAQALLRIVNDILDFSKIEAGKLEMENVSFQLTECVKNTLSLLQDSATSKDLGLSYTINPDIPETLIGDPLRLGQILTNLVGNAIKFTEEGSVHVAILPVATTKNQITLKFVVQDTGVGIAAPRSENLFAVFSQGDTSTTRRYGGTGLGLAISKRLVELMNGSISFISTVGVGTTFMFTAVFSTKETNIKPASSSVQQDQELSDQVSKLRGKKILLAEDNEINQLVAVELLEKVGFQVSVANNGKEAVEMALKNPFDLIFMDIQMPEMDGLSAAKEIRSHSALFNVPIVAMTAHAMVGDKEKSIAAGMNDHITKPLDITKVYSTIAKWVQPDNPDALTVSEQVASVLPDNPWDIAGKTRGEILPHLAQAQFTSTQKEIPVDSADSPPSLTEKEYIDQIQHLITESPLIAERINSAVMLGEEETVIAEARELELKARQVQAVALEKVAQEIQTAMMATDYPDLFLRLDILEKNVALFIQTATPLLDKTTGKKQKSLQ